MSWLRGPLRAAHAHDSPLPEHECRKVLGALRDADSQTTRRTAFGLRPAARLIPLSVRGEERIDAGELPTAAGLVSLLGRPHTARKAHPPSGKGHGMKVRKSVRKGSGTAQAVLWASLLLTRPGCAAWGARGSRRTAPHT